MFERCVQFGCAMFIAAGLSVEVSGAAEECEHQWLHEFPHQQVVGAVKAMTVFDDGSGPALYVAGLFEFIGDLVVNHIAKWDGESWSPLGLGLDNGWIESLEVFDDGSGPALYVAGGFYVAGDVEARGIAKWDGSSWSAVSCLEGAKRISALKVLDTGTGPALYVGGRWLWLQFDGRLCSVVRLTSCGCECLGGFTEPNNYTTVFDMEVYDDGSGVALYTAGFIHIESEVYVAGRWDGLKWTGVGEPMSSDFSYRLAVWDDPSHGESLFVSGWFESIGDATVHNIARWNGQNWEDVGGGFVDSSINALTVHRGDHGDSVLVAGGVQAGLVKWDGQQWTTMMDGADGIVSVLSAEQLDGRLYVGGLMAHDHYVPGTLLVQDDGAWNYVGAPNGAPNGPVTAFARFSDGNGVEPDVYIGGSFTGIEGQAAGHVARRVNGIWQPLPTGIDVVLGPDGRVLSRVTSMAVFNDGNGPALYVGGDFQSVDGIPANGIARWDGHQWTVVEDQSWRSVTAMAVLNDGSGSRLYAAVLDAEEDAHTYRSNGRTWEKLGGTFSDLINSMTVFDDGTRLTLIAGGRFSFVDDVQVNQIAAWNGDSWESLAGGLEGSNRAVTTMVTFDGVKGRRLYVGGRFTKVGGIESVNMAAWNGRHWEPVRAPAGGPLQQLIVAQNEHGNSLYCTTLVNAARLDGLEWSTIARSSTDSFYPTWSAGRLLATYNDHGRQRMMLAGDFTSINDEPGTHMVSSDLCATTGDFNHDGAVNVGDVLSLLLNWGDCADGRNCASDLTGDGIVDVDDLALLLYYWNEYGASP